MHVYLNINHPYPSNECFDDISKNSENGPDIIVHQGLPYQKRYIFGLTQPTCDGPLLKIDHEFSK